MNLSLALTAYTSNFHHFPIFVYVFAELNKLTWIRREFLVEPDKLILAAKFGVNSTIQLDRPPGRFML